MCVYTYIYICVREKKRWGNLVHLAKATLDPSIPWTKLVPLGFASKGFLALTLASEAQVLTLGGATCLTLLVLIRPHLFSTAIVV